jgi:hypothetical protein
LKRRFYITLALKINVTCAIIQLGQNEQNEKIKIEGGKNVRNALAFSGKLSYAASQPALFNYLSKSFCLNLIDRAVSPTRNARKISSRDSGRADFFRDRRYRSRTYRVSPRQNSRLIA